MTGRRRPFQEWVGKRGARQALYFRRGVLTEDGRDVRFEDGRLLSRILSAVAEEARAAGATMSITVEVRLGSLTVNVAPEEGEGEDDARRTR